LLHQCDVIGFQDVHFLKWTDTNTT